MEQLKGPFMSLQNNFNQQIYHRLDLLVVYLLSVGFTTGNIYQPEYPARFTGQTY